VGGDIVEGNDNVDDLGVGELKVNSKEGEVLNSINDALAFVKLNTKARLTDD